MTKPTHVADLFDPLPKYWGLRGDVWVWRDMHEQFAGVASPETGDELAAQIEAMFQRLTGIPVTHPENTFIKKYSHGGISSGVVCPAWWRETGIPMLRSRFEDR